MKKLIYHVLWLMGVLGVIPAYGQIKLPQIIRDSMILQRDARVNIWGWASAGEKITVKFNSRIYKTLAAGNGKWTLQLAPSKAGGPFVMELEGKNKIVLRNILIGDVWLCSGQSNMEHQMKLHDVIYAREVAEADNTWIRQFKIPNIASLERPQEDLPFGSWKYANPADVRAFSAVAYFFACKIYEKYKVPVGIINATWGGTPIEAWMSEDGFMEFPSFLEIIKKNKDTAYINGMKKAVSLPRSFLPDKGLEEKWFDISYTPKGWRTIAVPGYWEDQGLRNLDGVVWYRREINLPETMASVRAKIFLGRIVDADELYVNGIKAGVTSYMYPQRRYELPDGLLKPGKNMLVVRVSNNNGKGGFVPDKPYKLIAGNDTIDLTGYWQYKVGQVYMPQRTGNSSIAWQNQPAALYNAMLAPVIPYSLKGFVWYQGESNTGRPDEYARLQPAMITDWRIKWSLAGAPFLLVQLPGFMDYDYVPVESGWAAFREAQAKSLTLPNTGMAVAIDLGEWNDIHPDRKKEVGERLALNAFQTAYGEKITGKSPMYQSSKTDGKKIILSFNNTGSGLVTSDGEAPSGFAIAGEDKKFVWAEARIEKSAIIVSNTGITAPKYVRYAWADNPVNPNVYNKEGLPLAPFRTDE
ncbi:sialate O-acetylesterase [Niabella aquatica]